MKVANDFDKALPSTIKEINLAELFIILRKRIRLVGVVTLLFLSIGFYVLLHESPLYTSTTRIIIGAQADEMKTLQVIIKDVTVLQKVVDELNLPLSPEKLVESIEVESVDSSQVVNISVVYPDPILSAEIANKTAEIFKEEAPSILNFSEIRFLSAAKVNTEQINKSSGTTLKFGLIGLTAGIGLAFLVNIFDYTIRNEQEIEEKLGFTVIGKISKMNKSNTKDILHSPIKKGYLFSKDEKLRGGA